MSTKNSTLRKIGRLTVLLAAIAAFELVSRILYVRLNFFYADPLPYWRPQIEDEKTLWNYPWNDFSQVFETHLLAFVAIVVLVAVVAILSLLAAWIVGPPNEQTKCTNENCICSSHRNAFRDGKWQTLDCDNMACDCREHEDASFDSASTTWK